MRSMTVCCRTLSNQQDRARRRGRLPLPSIPLVLLILGLLSMSAYSKNGEASTQEQTENKTARTADAPKMGGHTFSSDLRLDVFIIREAGGERERIGVTPSARPLDIPRCASWGVRPIGRVDMEALARPIAAKKIPHLRFGSWAVDSDLAHLKGLAGLRKLNLMNTQITDAGLAHLKGMTGLRKLKLSDTKITNAGLAHLKGMTGLRKLHLGGPYITLGGPYITDAGLTHLKGMTWLRELYLRETQITDAGLAHLKGLTELRRLDLANTWITDAGLTHLKGMTELRKLDLGYTKITNAGLADMKKALPKTDIRRYR